MPSAFGRLITGVAPEKKEGEGALCLDWDRSYLVPMKYCLRFEWSF